MRRKLFIIVPSLSPTGPVKGAIALANSLIASFEVTLVSVKKGVGAAAAVDSQIENIWLSNHSSSFLGRLKKYKSLLIEAGGRNSVASISMCFSADSINVFCRQYAFTCSSVRGNLINIYKMDYGIRGLPVAIFHLISLAAFDEIVAMSSTMAVQIKFFSRKMPIVIGNFIDETQLSAYRKGLTLSESKAKRFVFVGSVSSRKKPLLLVRTVSILQDEGFDVYLDLIGDGPLMTEVSDEVNRLNLQDIVTLHGELSNPYPLISKADVFVLPSLSEGTSRASLEALFIGLPCVLRKIDGNSELVEDGCNGILFEKDSDLYLAMLSALNIVDLNSGHEDLLPLFFRQEYSSKKYLKLIQNH